MGEKETYAMDGYATTLFILDGDKQIPVKCEVPAFEIKAEPLPDSPIPWNPKPFTIESNASVMGTSLDGLLPQGGDEVTVNIVPSDSHLPRKWKKAVRAKYRRDTKWKRKAARWLERNNISFAGRISHDEDGITIVGKRDQKLK